ncbi:MAG: TatD family hydrolase [Candidatus Nomurabacteria bacterium]
MSLDLSKIEYIDIHSHLNFKDYGFDTERIIQNMNENKIATITIGTDLNESEIAKDMSLKYENLFYSIGLHPHDNEKEFEFAFENPKDYFSKLKLLGENEKCLAIGECGLDYFYIYKDLESGKITKEELELIKTKQKSVFKSHIDLALDMDLPLMLHIRPSEVEGNKEDAYLDTVEILKDYENIKGNFHFFVGTKNVLNIILNELPDFTVSIPAVCTFTSDYDEMIKSIPLNKIHIETDSPFVLPKNRRKEAKRNEPNFAIDVFDKICEIKNIEDKEEFKNILKENFKNLFLK